MIERRRSVRRVAVLGSSISLIVRPPQEGSPYPILLERLLNGRDSNWWLVENLSEVAAIIDDIRCHLCRLVEMQPDVILLHYGHVEAIRRPHSRRMWFWTHYYTPGISTIKQYSRALCRQYTNIRRLVRWTEQWTPHDRFKRILEESLSYLKRETKARIVLIEANPWNEIIEVYGPGSLGEIDKYNTTLFQVASIYEAEFISLNQLLDIHCSSLATLIPDGTHFSAGGHIRLAQVLAESILAEDAQKSRAAKNV